MYKLNTVRFITQHFLFLMLFLIFFNSSTSAKLMKVKGLALPNVQKILMNKTKVVAGEGLVLTMIGTNLNLVSLAKIKQQNVSAGTAILEKYSSMNSTQRRIIIDIKYRAKKGVLELILMADKTKLKLPSNFILMIK